MNVLIISPTPTHPASAGNRARILNLADSLIQLECDVYFAWIPLEFGDIDAMKNKFGESHVFCLDYKPPIAVTSIFKKIIRKLLAYIGNEKAYTWMIDDWFDPLLIKQLKGLYDQFKFDVILVEYVFISKSLTAFPNSVLKIIDTHDKFADRHKKYLAAAKEPEWFSTTEIEEAKAFERADAILAIQKTEALEFAKYTNKPIFTVGHLLDITEQCNMSSLNRVVFVASSNIINVDASIFFIEKVLPLIKNEIVDFKLVLAGDICNCISDNDDVIKLGRVNSVKDAYQHGCIAINPVLMGSGLSIKTMECLALGVPLISSEVGIRGLEKWSDNAFIVVQNGDVLGMAKAIINLLTNQAARELLKINARKAASEWNHDQMFMLQKSLAIKKIAKDI